MSLPKARIPWPRDELAETLARLRAKGLIETVVLADGCFDGLRAAHVRALEAAAGPGQLRVVALRTDAAARKLAGSGRSVLPLRERAEIVAALRCVDAVTSFDEETLERTFAILAPDLHAEGTDGAPRQAAPAGARGAKSRAKSGSRAGSGRRSTPRAAKRGRGSRAR